MKRRAHDARAAETAAFLASLEIRRRMCETEDEEIFVESTAEGDAAAREECRKHCRPYDTDLAAGQVRMLSQTKDPTYGLVARRWDERSWLLLPFSGFSHSATDLEIRTRTDGGMGLRVLQLWNARSVSDSLLSESWLVGTFSAEDLEDAVSAWRSSIGLAEFTDDQVARTGLPILRRDDPRLGYEEACLENFARLDALDLALEQAAEEEQVRLETRIATARELLAQRGRPFFRSPCFGRGLALAAAPAEEAVAANCPVEGFDGVVHVRYLPARRQLRLRVFDGSGNRSAGLDGWTVLGSGATVLGQVRDGTFTTTFESGFDGVVALMDDAGRACVLAGTGE